MKVYAFTNKKPPEMASEGLVLYINKPIKRRYKGIINEQTNPILCENAYTFLRLK